MDSVCVCVIRMDLCNVKMFQISSLEPALVTLFLVPYNRFLLEGCHPASNSGRSCGRMFWVASRCDVTVSYHAGRKHVWICKIWNRMELYEDLVDLNLHEEKHRTKWIVLIFTEGLGGGKGVLLSGPQGPLKINHSFFRFPLPHWQGRTSPKSVFTPTSKMKPFWRKDSDFVARQLHLGDWSSQIHT